MKTVRASSPARVDLAGGTLDIWPLGLLFKNAMTINSAISLRTHATVSRRKDKKIVIVSEDRGKNIKFDSLDNISHDHYLGLLSLIVEHFISSARGAVKKYGVDIVTRSDVPAGAGLGGSSSLAISLCMAMAKYTGKALSDESLLETARDLEAIHLQTATGVQDYIAAIGGGINICHFEPGGTQTEKVSPAHGRFLHKHLLLCYSGKSRNSGINNQEIFRSILDRDKKVIRIFEKIVESTADVRSALLKRDYNRFSLAISEEWALRKKLFPAISTPAIDKGIRLAKKAGADSARVCGAGGGGCFFLLAKPETHEKVAESLRKNGAMILDHEMSDTGIEITEK